MKLLADILAALIAIPIAVLYILFLGVLMKKLWKMLNDC